MTYTLEQRLMILDAWQRSEMKASDFSKICGVGQGTLGDWRQRFSQYGIEGLTDKPRGSKSGSRLTEVTKRAILMIKNQNPSYGIDRISALLERGPGLAASPNAILRFLKESGYKSGYVTQKSHDDGRPKTEKMKEKRYSSRPMQMWQTDIFTFLIHRTQVRVYLVVFMDDWSRYIVSYGLWTTMTTPMVQEVLRAGISSHGAPESVLTDQGRQYYAWRGKTKFQKELRKRGIQHIVSAAHRPQTLGKVERYWRSYWEECAEAAAFRDLDDARRRTGIYIDGYNFRRPHQGIENLVPADRFFGAQDEVRKTLDARVAANALILARDGIPKKSVYLTGQFGDLGVSVHTEGDKVVYHGPDGREENVDLVPGVEALPEPVTAMGKEPEDGNEEDDDEAGIDGPGGSAETSSDADGGVDGADEPESGSEGVGDIVHDVLRHGAPVDAGDDNSMHAGTSGTPVGGENRGQADSGVEAGESGVGAGTASAAGACADDAESVRNNEGAGEAEGTWAVTTEDEEASAGQG